MSRRVFTAVLASTLVFYGASVPVALYSLRYRDFFVEYVPGGEAIGDLIDNYELGAGSRAPGTATDGSKAGQETELTRYAETRAKASGWVLKPASEGKPAQEGSITEVAKARAEDAAREAKLKAGRAVVALKKEEQITANKVVANVEAVVEETQAAAVQVKEKVREVASNVVESVAAVAEPVIAVVEEVITPAPSPTVIPTAPVVQSSRPRELDATPLPPKKSNNEIYNGPPLPIGFEPPPGFEVARAPSTPKNELKPVLPPPAPLPLIAPAVKDVASSEPMLGQLAATIDSLATFVANNTDAVSSSASSVLTSAQADIQALGARLEAIKKEEHAKLEASLKVQASEYSGLLLAAEKELVERLDTQEEDWKKAFDQERHQLVSAYKEKLDRELETQQEIINLRLKEEVVAQGIELQRRWVREIKVRVEQERGGRLAKLEELEGGIRKLEKATKENEEIVSESVRARKIWTAVKAVEHQIETGAPFDDELRALRRLVATKAANAEADSTASLISIALSTVSDSVASSGITSFPSLAARFTTSVSPSIRRAALLPEHGGIFAYLASFVLSHLLFEKKGWAEGDDVISVIARTEWYLVNKDLDGAAKEVNTLQGWPKKLATDWLVAARSHLEVKQAFEVSSFTPIPDIADEENRLPRRRQLWLR